MLFRLTLSPLFLLVSSYCLAADPVYTINTVVGSASVGDGGPATAAVLTTSQAIALDAAGTLYISDTDAHRVRRVAADGMIRTIAGSGVPGFSGDGGPADRAQLRNPYGLAFDWRGNFYIADLGNARIRKITPDGTITTIAGGGAVDPVDGIRALDAKFLAPRNVAIDGDLGVAFSDFSGHRIYRVNSFGVLTILAGNGRVGASPDGTPARQAFLPFPTALAYDSYGGLYLCDTQSRAVKRLQNDSMRTVAQAAAPTGLSFDAAGNLYVADAGGGQVLRLQPSGAVGGLQTVARDVAAMPNGVLYLAQGSLIQRRTTAGVFTVVAGGGDSASGDSGPALDARLRLPSGLARDAAGNLYIADQANNRIRRITADGTVSTVPAGALKAPSAIAIHPSGSPLYIADTGNHRIQQVNFDSKDAASILTIAGTGAPGFSGDDGPGVFAQLDSPGYVVLAADGSLYIADTANGRIRQFRNGVIKTVASKLIQPRGLAFDPAGNLYIATGETRLSRLLPNGTLEAWPPEETFLSGARGVSVDENGDVLVADTGNHRIRRIAGDSRPFSPITGRVLTIAGLTTPSFSGDQGPALDAQLNAPFDVLAGPGDTIWIADADNHRIRMLTPGVQGPQFEELKTLTVLNAASLASGPIAPGELLVLPNLPVDAAATLNGAPADILRGASSWIVAPQNLESTEVVIETTALDGATLGRITLPVVAATPAIFTQADRALAAALNSDGTPNGPANGEFRTNVITFYATGLGKLDEDQKPAAPVRLTMNGIEAEILFCGPAPGAPAILQINASIPNGFYPSGAIPVILTAAGQASPVVSIYVR